MKPEGFRIVLLFLKCRRCEVGKTQQATTDLTQQDISGIIVGANLHDFTQQVDSDPNLVCFRF